MKEEFEGPSPFSVRVAISALLSACICAATSVQAAEEEVTEELQEVHITGTRIQVPGAYTAPNPITSVTSDEMDRLGMVNVADALTLLVPQNISDVQPDNVGLGSWFVGQTIANLRGLNANNGFFTTGSRTLTMVDGRRVVSSSNQADVVDLNMIPSNLLQRMDVVTGGASATYGSGAMAGVVNLVLNNRLQGINLDMDYGVHEPGDGENKHVSVSGGTMLFEGRGHFLASAEWQKQDAINDCSAERDWCARSRGLFSNGDILVQPGSAFAPWPGYEGMPSRFQVDNLRRSQWSSNGAISLDNANAVGGFKFNDAGTDIAPYTPGFRGGSSRGGSVLDGDGPLATYNNTLVAGNDRKTLFSHFEFDFNDRMTGYAEANFSRSSGANPQYGTVEDVCVRFHTAGVAPQAGQVYPAGTIVWFFGGPPGAPTFGQMIGVAGFNDFVGTFGFPVIQSPQQALNATWGFDRITLNLPFTSSTIPAVLPTLQPGTPGAASDANAYLSTLSDAARAELLRVASTPANPNTSAAGNLPSAGSNQDGNAVFRGTTPCTGMAALTKVFNPQINQVTTRESETVRGVLGLKGRFGSSWRYDMYYQYGATDTVSLQQDARTSYRLAFALDSVIDHRPTLPNGDPNPTYNQPVCRYVRDGLPATTFGGDQLSDPEGIASLLEGCEPMNPFGQAASAESLAYAFRPMRSSGRNTLHVLSATTSGTLWQGWGAGPLTGAFGAEFRKDTVNNQGSEGNEIERVDFKYNWGDAFSGTTEVIEEYAELNMPLISEKPGVNLWSVNAAVRHGRYRNQGGVGTTGESGTQTTTNWKASMVFEPFDFMRFRITRSRDLRAATYRELYNNSSGVPDATTGTNYWRAYNPTSTTARTDRMTNIFGGNADLRPEKSDTLTIGLVLSPGGWAQGMRFTADYYNIRVKDGLVPDYENPIEPCWSQSENQDPVVEGGVVIQPAVNGNFDADNPYCKRIIFGAPDPESVGTPFEQYSNITGYRSSYINAEPFQTRGLDLALNYVFAASDLFEEVPGSLSLTIRANRALEASALVSNAFFRAFIPGAVDYVGQLGPGLGFVPGIQPTPKWSGNIIASYVTGPATVSLSARYIGGAKIDKVYYADGPGQTFVPAPSGPAGSLVDVWGGVGSIDDNSVPAYFNFALNGSYDLPVSGVRQLQVNGTINNLFDKDPPFSGGFQSGANPQFHDVRGRSYRLGVRMRF